MATYRKDGDSKRAQNFIMAVIFIGLGNAILENGEAGLGLIMMAVGGVGILVSIFPTWHKIK